MNRPTLHIAFPVFNESINLPILLERLDNVITSSLSQYTCKIIAVDDGSRDDSYEVLKKLKSRYDYLQIIKFSRNFGHHNAIAAALQHCDGQVNILMDSDLQDPPESIPSLIALLDGDVKMVYTIRNNYRVGLLKKWSSALFWRLIKKGSGLDIPEGQSMLRAFDRNVLLALRQCKEYHKFYAGLFAYVGFKYSTYTIDNQLRANGQSSYSWGKMIKLGFTALSGFSHNMATFIVGFSVLWIGIGMALFACLQYMGCLINTNILFLLILIIGAKIIFFQGIIIWLLLYVFQQSKNRPAYIIEHIIE